MQRFREWSWADEENECTVCGQSTNDVFNCENCELEEK